MEQRKMKKYNTFRKNSQGFSMIELLLVGALMLTMSALYIQSQIRERNLLQAKNVGQQMKMLGDAVNSYIVNKYPQIGSMTNATGAVSDLGPRVCNAGTNTCTITTATLVAEGLLPTGFASVGPFTDYNIILRRSGTAPSWNIDGLSITSAGWIEPGTTIVKYDLAGEALRAIGPNGGMTFMSTTNLSGYQGTWTEVNTNYSNINALGQIAVRSGSGASGFTQFLRRDGTLPMTGDLDMGGNNIKNIGNISTGTAPSACKRVELTSSGQIYSRDGACTSRFETDPNTGKMLAKNNVGIQKVEIDSQTGNIGAAGTAANDLPSGYVGVRTKGVYADSAIAVGASSGTSTWFNAKSVSKEGAAGFNSAGDAWVSNDLIVKNNIYLNDRKTPLRDLLPEFVSRGVEAVANGQVVAKPDCSPYGTAKIVITPSIISAPIVASVTTQVNMFYANGFVARAQDWGTIWYIELSGLPYGYAQNYGLAHKYCFYDKNAS